MKKTTIQLILILVLINACSTKHNVANEGKDSIETIKERMQFERSENIVIEQKIDRLLSEMTLKEKVGQMIQIAIDAFSEIKEYDKSESGITEISLDSAKLMTFLNKYPIGSVINGYGFSAENWYQFGYQMQGMVQNNTRLKIPILHSADHQHGANYVNGSTIFPHSLNMAATFNTELTQNEAKILSIETAALGHHWILGPLGDVGVNPLWPRIFETYGEDPYLASTMVSNYLKGQELAANEISPYKQINCAKHFIGYSNPTGTWDRTPSDISMQSLWETHIPPFKTLIDEGIEGIMLNSGELNGEAVHGSYDIVTTLLRDQLAFKGVVITDWEDINKLYKYHKRGHNAKEATLIALNAGIDMTMAPYNLDFGDYVIELIKEGKISEERINLSVARILRMKFKMDLFEHALPSKQNMNQIGIQSHQIIAEQASTESIVLLKNKHILPLNKNKSKIVVAGPNANIKRSLTGAWTLRWWPQTDAIFPENMPTFYQALKHELNNTNIILSDKKSINKDAANADVILLALGELPHAEGFGNVNDMNLPHDQEKLLQKAIASKKPIVVVMIGARPMYMNEYYDQIDAFIWAGLPGIHGGCALAEIITGKANPSGKMPFSYPLSSGHYYNYNHKPSHTNYDIAPQNENIILASFGDGLSYSSFNYKNLIISDSTLSKRDSIRATITLSNTSVRDGMETILWYITDEEASITRPVKQLKHFEKTRLKPGLTKQYHFTITSDMLSFPNKHGEQILEEGYFTIQAGNLSTSFRLIR